jgi:hypothetical protein
VKLTTTKGFVSLYFWISQVTRGAEVKKEKQSLSGKENKFPRKLQDFSRQNSLD